MALNINGAKLRKCNVDGVKCKRINVNGVKVWSADVAITNRVGSGVLSNSATYDMGALPSWNALLTVNDAIVGHRYLVYGGNVRRGEDTFYSEIVVSDGGTEYILCDTYGGEWGYPSSEAVIHTAKSTSMTFAHKHSGRAAADTYFAGTEGYLFMVVDITELEEEKGKTYTAETFMNEVGLFYNTKTVEI